MTDRDQPLEPAMSKASSAAMVEDFLRGAEKAGGLLGLPQLAERWDRSSVLEGYTVAELAGHFVRAVGTTNAVLVRGQAEGPPISGLATYYAARIESWGDRAGEIRSNTSTETTLGPKGIVVRYQTALAECRGLLGSERPSLVRTSAGDVLSLSDYLLVRAVELVTHADDLAASLGLPLPDLPLRLVRSVTGLLVDVARVRHGEMAVLRALARRERDQQEALRVI